MENESRISPPFISCHRISLDLVCTMNYRPTRYIRAQLVHRGFTEKSSVGSYFAERNAIRQIFNGSWMNSGRNPVNVHTSNRRNGFSLLLGDKLFAPRAREFPSFVVYSIAYLRGIAPSLSLSLSGLSMKFLYLSSQCS